ncbi:hypothetical protein FLG15_20430 [Xanthomonas phaseoli pv. dieffenbachiae]
MELAQRRPRAGCQQSQCNERSTAMTYKCEATNLPQPSNGNDHSPEADRMHAIEPTEVGPTN